MGTEDLELFAKTQSKDTAPSWPLEAAKTNFTIRNKKAKAVGQGTDRLLRITRYCRNNITTLILSDALTS
jgi:hypothetical protein